MPNRLPFPSSEGDLDSYFKLNIPYLISNATRLQISSSHQAALIELLEYWNAIYPKSVNLDLRTKSITSSKNKIREELIKVLRKIFSDIPASAYTISDRTTLNLPQKKEYRSAPPIPSTIPKGTININNRLQHTISFYNTGSLI